MSIEQMREKIADIYGNSTWANKVAHMSDSQVTAIYFRMKDKGYFDKHKKYQRTKQLALF